jgi:hypothetical protein
VIVTQAEARLKKMVVDSPEHSALQLNIKVLKSCEVLAWPIKGLTLVDIRKHATIIHDAAVDFPRQHQQLIVRYLLDSLLEAGQIDKWATGLWPFGDAEEGGGDEASEWRVGSADFSVCPPLETDHAEFKESCITDTLTHGAQPWMTFI